jgi:hypothetical protein
MDDDTLHVLIRRALSDPGKFTARAVTSTEPGGGKVFEPLGNWQAKAVCQALSAGDFTIVRTTELQQLRGTITGPGRHADGGVPAPRRLQQPSLPGETTATTGIRHDLFIGPVRYVALDDECTGTRVSTTLYELDVIDGWVRQREWTDEGNDPARKSRVREILDAVPECTEFIAASHPVWWVKALQVAGLAQKAGAQRRALNDALRRHGLALAPPPGRNGTRTPPAKSPQEGQR